MLVDALHWERTLQHKGIAGRIGTPRNSTRRVSKPQYWRRDVDMNSTLNFTSRRARVRAVNDFFHKSNILTSLVRKGTESHSLTMVIVVASVLLFVTISITAAVIVFCKKRNAVFALQKAEQEDEAEYELDDINTDSDTDGTVSCENQITQVPGSPMVEINPLQNITSSALSFPDVTESPSRKCLLSRRSLSQNPSILEKYSAIIHETSDDSATDTASEFRQEDKRLRLLRLLNKHYYAFSTLLSGSSDIDSDNECRPNEDPPSYDSLQTSKCKSCGHCSSSTDPKSLRINLEPLPLKAFSNTRDEKGSPILSMLSPITPSVISPTISLPNAAVTPSAIDESIHL
ncbi:unnamed protein product [Dimorphilus gyrociliatus]|uniref:Uncharacterized protein n=1 Tax=Dimorphilus gyrociliatus TaxID=2664684 RepID=A0A7I8V643_9ANNE|nr:unnamed protein product [Dimorphilus gyrociliatus]